MASSIFGPSESQLGILGTSGVGGVSGVYEVYDSSAPIGLSDTSTFDPTGQLVDPTNTGDTGAVQDTSTPTFPSLNNPETAGNPSLGAVLDNAINAGFSAWQLSTLPKGTPKSVSTTVGTTKVTAGTPTLVGSLFGATTPQQSQTITLVILVIVGLIIYKLVTK